MKNTSIPILVATAALLVISSSAFADRDDNRPSHDSRDGSTASSRTHDRGARDRGTDKTHDRGNDRTRDRGSDRNDNHSTDRTPDRNTDRTPDRNTDRTYDRNTSGSHDWWTSRTRDHGTPGSYDRGSSRGYDHSDNRTYDRRPSGAYDRWTGRDGHSTPKVEIRPVIRARVPAHTTYERSHSGRFYYHHPKLQVSIGLNFGYYAYSRPSWGEVCYSPYWHYGHMPTYVLRDRVVIVDRPIIIAQSSDYYLDRENVRSYQPVLDDIREAWRGGSYVRLTTHLRDSDNVAVYRDGRYDYSLESGDYRAMTRDAMDQVDTRSFDFVRVDRRGATQVNAIARHIFRDQDGVTQTVYASFLLNYEGGEWWIVAVGSSASEIGIQ